MKIIYAGTPEFAVPALELLAGRPADRPALVLTQPDRPAGRGRRLQASPVKRRAKQLGLDIAQPQSLEEPQLLERLQRLAPDLIVVAAYGLLLPAAVLKLPRHGCWNIHASLLPRWRGAAPVQHAIAAGDRATGISIMHMDQGLDTGPVYLRRRIPIAAGDTGGTLTDKLALLGAESLRICLQQLHQGALPEPVPQDPAGASHAPRLRKQDARIDWREPAGVIARKIRAYNPWPAAWTVIAGRRTIIWSAEAAADAGGAPGRVLDATGRMVIACGSGALAILELQPAGARRMPVGDWLNAHGRDRPARID